jgi:putative phosphoribosyl transferase
MEMNIIKDRREAGRQLADKLRPYRGPRTVVLALPRGGLPVAAEIATALAAPLDIFVVRKLGAPGNPEYAIGAIAQGGTKVLDHGAIQLLGISETELAGIIARESAELQRRLILYRGNRPQPKIKNQPVIVVDDGLATGLTARAAVHALYRQQPKKIILAAPVCARDTAGKIRQEQEVDTLICLAEPANFMAVAQWYEHFPQLTDREVLEILDQTATSPSA